MSIQIKKVTTKKELKQFIRFNYELYKDNPYSVPDLYEDMLKTFSSKKNAAFDFCEADYFLAYQDGKLVGRVAAIINHRANETWQSKTVRFGWIDFIDDKAVSRALIDAVIAWGRERGMTTTFGIYRYGCRRYVDRRLRPTLYDGDHLQLSLLSGAYRGFRNGEKRRLGGAQTVCSR